MIYTVKASCFATLGDLQRYKAAIARGESQWSALSEGDNGIGCFGDNTAQVITPMCALPPEIMAKIWGSIPSARHQQVLVKLISGNDQQSAICTVADEDEHVVSWTNDGKTDYRTRNGCGIDLNPATLKALGFDPNDDEFEELVTWGPVEAAKSIA